MLKFLSNHGVLGINARNLLYVKPFNPKKATAFADDKLKTKAFLTARGIPAAKIYARIESREQLRTFDYAQLPDECVLKPNYGFGGEGIIILKGRDDRGRFLRSGKTPIEPEELFGHIEDILDGKFSLGGRRDTPFFEQILEPHECFSPFRPVGLPDIRVIIFNLVPVMAMLRIPTAESDGKANLHLGGIGLGIDIAKGTTTHAAQYHHMIDTLPHGGTPAGIALPHWEDILLISSRIQHVTNIGYLAVDITIDQSIGPAVLEVNARAGLNVQVANLAPLRSRLERVKGLTVSSPEKGVRIGQDLFGEKIAGTAVTTEERPVLGLQETIVISGDGSTIREPCYIDPDEERTTFTPSLIEELKAHGAVEPEDSQTGTYRVKFALGAKKIQTLAATAPSGHGSYRAVIGRRDLAGFLLDPSKKKEATPHPSSVHQDLRAVDKLFAQIDRELLILKYIKPTNLEEERARLVEDKKYNPVFAYRALEFDTAEMKKRLRDSVDDSSTFGQLLEKKRKELLKRIELFTSRGQAPEFTKASIALYGKPTKVLLSQAQAFIDKRVACLLPTPPDALMDAEEAKELFEAVLKSYSLHDWQVVIRSKLVADCTVGGKFIYLRETAHFSQDHIDALIKHEIETHVLTAENGDHQPYALLRRGTAGYLDTQEGLATYNQNMVYGPDHDKRYNAPRNLLSIEFGLTHTFAETRLYLEELGYDEQKAMTQAIAVKRGLQNTADHGGFTKGIAYFRGLKAIEKYVKAGGNLKRLYIGKITLEDLALIEQIPELQKPLLIPEFLRQVSDS